MMLDTQDPAFQKKNPKKSDLIDWLWPNSYDGIGKMGRFN